MMRTRTRNGSWLQLEQDVFALASFPRTWSQRCRAATLTHPAAALSHTTSSVRLGLDGFRPGRVEITVPTVAHHQSDLAVVHRSRHLQFELVGGVRTTTFAQTMVQLAGCVGPDKLRSALHSGLHARPSRIGELHTRISELRDRRMPGMGRLIEELDDLDGEPPTASELERLLMALLDRLPEIPGIERQVAMAWQSDRDTIVDAFIPAWGLIIEADGRRWHTRVQDFESDRWRDAEALAHGLHVLRVTWRQLRDAEASVVDHLLRIGAALGRRAA